MNKNSPFLIAAIVLFGAINAFAYLDAGTGSYFIQILIGVIAASLYSIKLFWKRIVFFFQKGSKDSKRENELH
jgi:hypothetical protein